MKNLPTAAYKRRQFFETENVLKRFRSSQVVQVAYMYVDGQNNTVQVIFSHEDFV